ncbi:MAG: ubiquitin carboxyl-terminal hydrolase family protein [Oligoflexales bacterium]
MKKKEFKFQPIVWISIFLALMHPSAWALVQEDKKDDPLDILNILGIPLIQSDYSPKKLLDQGEGYKEGYKINTAFKGIKGLRNYGNTCYLNAITYLIANTNLQKIADESERSSSEGLSLPNLKLKKSLKNLLKSIKSKGDEREHQNNLRNYLKEVQQALKGKYVGSVYMQQDAAEFLELLLQALGAEGSEFEMIQREQITYADESKPVIYDRPYNILQLPLEGRCIKDLVKHYFKREFFQSSMQNNLEVDKFKQVGLVKSPKTLLVQLKRFAHLNKNRSPIELDRYLTLPFYSSKANGLSEQIDDETYRLKALVAHLGHSAKFGHYVSYEIKYKKTGTYLLKYDDEHISKVPMSELRTLLASDAYLLAYERKN